MLIRKIAIENVRSFLDRREMLFDGNISIVIGPNGGGKTNLLDITFTMLSRYLFAARYMATIDDGTGVIRYEMRDNDQLSRLLFERHSQGQNRGQVVEVEIEVSASDIANMKAIQSDAEDLRSNSKRHFASNPWHLVGQWNIDAISAGDRLVFTWKDGSLASESGERGTHFRQYLGLYDFDNLMRAEAGKAALQMSMVYLPVNRTSNGFVSSVSLAGYNDIDQKRTLDATSSRTGGSVISLAVGRLAQKYRLLQENDNTSAKEAFYSDQSLKALSADLGELGYEWELTTINALTNQYDITLKKQGSSFLVGAASSGERELLTYLFAVYALNVRNALIIVDEPELHLHPRWQTSLFNLFVKLAESTGNQFVLATHSPTFISPSSIQYVSRVFIKDQKSDIVRLNASGLPNAKHLFNVVNSQNNESVFFTDRVLLVEGISDRIFFERIFNVISTLAGVQRDPGIEIVSVGGKGFFPAYQKLLEACKVDYVVISDLDYIEQIGDETLKSLFVVNAEEIKKDVLDNIKSLDGAAIVQQIDQAMESGNWCHAKETWKYIKSRRITIKDHLTAEEGEAIKLFIDSKRAEGIYLLKCGAIEDYMPDGFKNKNLDKLIEFLSSDDFWDNLPLGRREELGEIAKLILRLPKSTDIKPDC